MCNARFACHNGQTTMRHSCEYSTCEARDVAVWWEEQSGPNAIASDREQATLNEGMYIHTSHGTRHPDSTSRSYCAPRQRSPSPDSGLAPLPPFQTEAVMSDDGYTVQTQGKQAARWSLVSVSGMMSTDGPTARR